MLEIVWIKKFFSLPILKRGLYLYEGQEALLTLTGRALSHSLLSYLIMRLPMNPKQQEVPTMITETMKSNIRQFLPKTSSTYGESDVTSLKLFPAFISGWRLMRWLNSTLQFAIMAPRLLEVNGLDLRAVLHLNTVVLVWLLLIPIKMKNTKHFCTLT